MTYDLGRRNFLGMGLGAATLALTPKLVSACFKKEPTLEEKIKAMPDSDFLKQYIPGLTQNAVTYSGYSGGYHGFKLGAPANASEQDKDKWTKYQLKDLFNQLFMKESPVIETVKLFLRDVTNVIVNPMTDLRVQMQGNLVDDVIYRGRNKDVLKHTGVRPGHIIWRQGEVVRINERYINAGVIQQLKGYVILQSAPEEPPKKKVFGEMKTKSDGLVERAKKFLKSKAPSQKPKVPDYTWDQPPQP